MKIFIIFFLYILSLLSLDIIIVCGCQNDHSWLYYFMCRITWFRETFRAHTQSLSTPFFSPPILQNLTKKKVRNINIPHAEPKNDREKNGVLA